jgi:CheY-like chemotaxis protein
MTREIKVLIADDSDDWREAFCEFLGRLGWKAEGVPTGSDLRQKLLQDVAAYDVVLVDNDMPESFGQDDLRYCGLKVIAEVVAAPHAAELHRRVIIRSVYSKEDIVDELRHALPRTIEVPIIPPARWFDRTVPLADLVSAMERVAASR